MLRRINEPLNRKQKGVEIAEAEFPNPYPLGLSYASPARGTWNIVHTGMLIPEAHEIFICAAGCLRGVVLTAAEMHAQERFSTIEIREENLLEGDLEELAIEGVTAIIESLPKRPPAVLVYTSCVHHFAGCDIPRIYTELEKRFPDIDFTDCYMNPIMRKSGLTPDQLMRSRLYMLLKERPKDKHAAAIIGNDFPTRQESELVEILKSAGLTVHEITSCKTYEEYQRMAESSVYISYYPAAAAGGEMLAKRLGGIHIYLPFSFDGKEIEEGFFRLQKILNGKLPDFSEKRAVCERAVEETLELVKDFPIAIDETFCPRPLSLARFLLDAGFSVKCVYLDVVSREEQKDFLYLQEHFPKLLLYPVSHVKMRFTAEKEKQRVLAIGQKAAYFENTDHFVNVVEGGGMFGYDAILNTLKLMREAYLETKDMKNLIQIKGLGCEGCL